MASKLEKIRISRGLSQRKLEQLSGVSQQTISRIEKGVPLIKSNTALKLAKVLECKLSDIMDNVCLISGLQMFAELWELQHNEKRGLICLTAKIRSLNCYML